MKVHIALLLTAILLSSCAQGSPKGTATQDSAPATQAAALGTVIASGPLVEVSFDGSECTMSGGGEFPAGYLVTRFEDSTGHIATPWLGRCYPGNTYQDLLAWIGPPGLVFHRETPPWFPLIDPVWRASESPTVSYRQYDLKIQAEYVIWIEYPSDYWWPCGSFQVGTTP